MFSIEPNLKLQQKSFLKLINIKFLKASNILAPKNKLLLTNFFSLGIIQGANILLPLLTFPYILRIIGVENFGLIVLLQTIMNYFVVITDYGFNMSATKDVSLSRGNKDTVSQVFFEVLFTKAFLCVLLFVGLLVVVISVPKFQVHSNLILFSFLIVVGQVLQPSWFFQGIERMKYITYITLITKALYAICIFIFVTKSSDFIFVNLITGMTSIVGGIISLIIAFNSCGLSYKLPGIQEIKSQLTNGWDIFISSITITIANNSNILILSLFTNTFVVGYYSIAEKVFYILRTFAVVLYQVIYPRVCLLSKDTFAHLSQFLQNILKLVLVIFLPLSIVIFFLADYIISLISGAYIGEAALILKIICFGPFIAALNIPAAQTMLAYHLNKKYAIIATVGAVVNILSNIVLAYHFQGIGTALSIIITETVVTALLYFVLGRYYPQYSFFRDQSKLVHI